MLSVALLLALSPLYRDLATGARNKWRGTSPADYLGPMAYDGRVLRDFSWGAWFWTADKALGFPRVQDLNTRPMYPVNLALAAALPPERAWATYFYLHAVLKLVGLVLLAGALGCPVWLGVLATTAAMVAEGSLAQFGDATYLGAGAWLPLVLWLTLRASRYQRWSGWDAAWSVAVALWALASHPQYGLYDGVLVLAVTLWIERGTLRSRLPALVVRHAAVVLLLLPWLLPAAAHYAESGRRHVLAFDDWHFRVAYTWWKYKLKWPQFLNAAFYPWVATLAVAAGAVVAGLRASRLWAPFAGYFVFGLFHAVPYLALPMWLTGVALLPFRIPERVFEPFTWLGAFLLADVTVNAAGWRRWVLAALMLVVLGSCLVQTTADPSTAYLQRRYDRPLPERLAALVRAEPRSPAVFVTGPDRAPDTEQPLLNSNHNLLLGIPGAHFLGEVPNLYYSRATYRVPGLLFMQRLATPVADWDDVVDVYAELGIGWVFWDGAGDPVHPRLTLAGEEHGFRLYRIRDAQPTIAALDRVRRVPAPVVPADVAAYVFALPSLGPFCYDCPVDAAATPAREVALGPHWRPGAVDIDVESARGTLVTLGETRSRGWRASVDGAPATIYALNEVFQAVAVPPGRHVVRWRFVSPGFFAGLVLAPLGLVLLGVAPWADAWWRARRAT